MTEKKPLTGLFVTVLEGKSTGRSCSAQCSQTSVVRIPKRKTKCPLCISDHIRESQERRGWTVLLYLRKVYCVVNKAVLWHAILGKMKTNVNTSFLFRARY